MGSERHKPATTPCLCDALRQATRAVSRLYGEELRGVCLPELTPLADTK